MCSLKFTEFPVFPIVTYDKKYDSPLTANWKIVTSIPQSRIAETPETSDSKLFLVDNEWLVVVWMTDEKRAGREGAEITLYEGSKGGIPRVYREVGVARTRALRGSQGVSLLETKVKLDMVQRKRYSGAIVHRREAIQIWLRLSEPEDQGSPTSDAITASASSPDRDK